MNGHYLQLDKCFEKMDKMTRDDAEPSEIQWMKEMLEDAEPMFDPPAVDKQSTEGEEAPGEAEAVPAAAASSKTTSTRTAQASPHYPLSMRSCATLHCDQRSHRNSS